MNNIQQFLTITGSLLIIASCQDINNESEVAASKNAVVDTVPKGRSDSMMNKPDTTISGMAAPRYIDLSTGQPVDLYYDAKKNRVYSVVTNEPVDFYVDLSSGDTIYGTGRYVVNNYIVKSPEGQYRLDMKKVKLEKNELKMKDGNKKFKMDKSDMRMRDQDMKMKDSDMKGDTSGRMNREDMNMRRDSSGKMKKGKY